MSWGACVGSVDGCDRAHHEQDRWACNELKTNVDTLALTTTACVSRPSASKICTHKSADAALSINA